MVQMQTNCKYLKKNDKNHDFNPKKMDKIGLSPTLAHTHTLTDTILNN